MERIKLYKIYSSKNLERPYSLLHVCTAYGLGFSSFHLGSCGAVVLWPLDGSAVAASQSKSVQVGLKYPTRNRPDNFLRIDDNNCEGNGEHSSHRLTYGHGRSSNRPQSNYFTASKTYMQEVGGLLVYSAEHWPIVMNSFFMNSEGLREGFQEAR